MQEFSFHINIEKPFGNLTLSDHVLLIVQTSDGKLLVSRKNSYPANIWRLIGGKPDKKETMIETAERELSEETLLHIPSTRINYLAAIHGSAMDLENNEYMLTTHLFGVHLQKFESPQASDDIDEIQCITAKQFTDLIKSYQNLSPNSWIYKNGRKKFSWYDYGQYYAPIHEIALNLVEKL